MAGECDLVAFLKAHEDDRILRRIIDLHSHAQPHECPEWAWQDPDHPEDPPETRTGWALDGACETLRLLALPHASRDGYRPEWAPTKQTPMERNPHMSSLEATDAASEAVRTGFRITLDDLKSRVATHEFIERGVLSVCLMQMDNGFWLVGKSAPVDPNNYDAEYGRQLAYDDALRQAWPLLAFSHLDRAREG